MPCAFIDLKKAYDRVSRGKLWEYLRLAETSECYIRNIKEMYDGVTTTVRSRAANLVDFCIEFKFEFEFSLFCEFKFDIFIFASSSSVKIYQVLFEFRK